MSRLRMVPVVDGDGLLPGAGFPQEGNSQKPDLLRGKLLRMELANTGPPKVPSDNPFVSGGGLPLVWASGVRNPWRASFDRETGDFWFGDVGGNLREEVNVEPMGTPGGRNYGWSTFEGKLPTGWSLPILPPTNSVGLVAPVFDHPHTLTNWGGSIVGGHVHRGTKVSELVGRYVFGDCLTGFLWSLKRGQSGVEVTRMKVVLPEGVTFGSVSSFGEDEGGEKGGDQVVAVGFGWIGGGDGRGKVDLVALIPAGQRTRRTQSVVSRVTRSA